MRHERIFPAVPCSVIPFLCCVIRWPLASSRPLSYQFCPLLLLLRPDVLSLRQLHLSFVWRPTTCGYLSAESARLMALASKAPTTLMITIMIRSASWRSIVHASRIPTSPSKNSHQAGCPDQGCVAACSAAVNISPRICFRMGMMKRIWTMRGGSSGSGWKRGGRCSDDDDGDDRRQYQDLCDESLWQRLGRLLGPSWGPLEGRLGGHDVVYRSR